MSKNIRAVLVVVLFMTLPFLFYAVLQIRSLADDEKVANAIYEKQMETILFSLNQTADEQMERWISKLTNGEQTLADNAAELILENESIQMLVLREMKGKADRYFVNEYVEIGPESKKNINSWYAGKDSIMNRLTEYYFAGFQKIQPAEDWPTIDGLNPNQSAVTVMLYDRDQVLHNALIVLQTQFWVEQNLGRDMQELAQDRLQLSIVQRFAENATPDTIYVTEAFDFRKGYVENPLWILPNTYLTIQSEGKSYAELIRNRSRTSLYVLLSSLFIMIIGTITIIRNVRKTMKVAQLKSDFVRNVSHEIRTPLSLIKMYSETLMLNRLPTEEKKQHYYEVINFESGRLTYLVNNILDFSKIEADRKTYELEEQELNQLVERVYASYLYTFKKNGVNHELILAPERLPVMVDPQAFDEALSNLIENAMKYSEEEKYLLLKTRFNKYFAFLEVTDRGIGIPKNKQTQIFDKFYRVEDVLTQKTRGTGLGLSLVKHIMDAHNCEVQLQSAVNKGSTFTLKFPLKQVQ